MLRIPFWLWHFDCCVCISFTSTQVTLYTLDMATGSPCLLRMVCVKEGDKRWYCIVRESNPGRPRGRRAFYHWTNDARLVAGGTADSDIQQNSSCGRVVKATDSKSVSLWERRFESYRLRNIFRFSTFPHREEYRCKIRPSLDMCIVGSVVECSPATRAARVRFPDDADFFLLTRE